MTTDTKAVTRFGGLIDNAMMVPATNGEFVRFTDHERVVGELREDVAHFKKFYEEAIDKLAEVVAAEQKAFSALAASRAEVEALKKLLPEVRMCVEYAIDYGSPSRRSERKELINTIDAAMENGNV